MDSEKKPLHPGQQAIIDMIKNAVAKQAAKESHTRNPHFVENKAVTSYEALEALPRATPDATQGLAVMLAEAVKAAEMEADYSSDYERTYCDDGRISSILQIIEALPTLSADARIKWHEEQIAELRAKQEGKNDVQ